ncbi:hypothetical protein ABE65_020655 [Fictibacillus phosphorivorans]|uniref:AEC family transporter n=1 Tax=Fictibacillus phosphorivorans TaxID=1221500 RepID=A0A160ISJ7_9BACL|nr:AEC family transporter [Fictibacillus phosphorivorans]ANC79082.1 hypothetical protein ABE65_020655 [Fictibacillus phosphorivorans]
MKLAPFMQELTLLYSIALIGYILRKKEVLPHGSERTLSVLLLNVTLPALIVFGMDVPFSIENLKQFGWLSLMSAFVLLLSSLFSWWRVKQWQIKDTQKNALEGIMIFGNQGFLGIAVCFILFGKTGVLFATFFNFVYLLWIWTYGIYLFARHSKVLPWRSVFLNPGVISTLIGFILLLLPGTLPHALSNTLEMLGKPTVPLSMLLIGVLLGGLPFNHLISFFKKSHLWLASFYKLLLFPMLLIPYIFFSLPLELVVVAVLTAGMPSAPTISMYAERYGEDASFAAAGVMLSTILSCLTIPLLYALVLIISSFTGV